MPLSTYLILQSPQVAMIRTTSSQIAFALQNTNVAVGVVDTVNYLCNNAIVGNNYMFNKTNAIIVNAGGTEYYIVNEDDISGQEQPLL